MSNVYVQVERERDRLMLRYYEPVSSFPQVHERRSTLPELELRHESEGIFKPLGKRPSSVISDLQIHKVAQTANMISL